MGVIFCLSKNGSCSGPLDGRPCALVKPVYNTPISPDPALTPKTPTATSCPQFGHDWHNHIAGSVGLNPNWRQAPLPPPAIDTVWRTLQNRVHEPSHTDRKESCVVRQPPLHPPPPPPPPHSLWSNDVRHEQPALPGSHTNNSVAAQAASVRSCKFQFWQIHQLNKCKI